MNQNFDTEKVFADPAAWLARFGIAAEVVETLAEQPLAEAA
ncbi:MAG: hypothetical protein DIU67_000980 [Actinomycetes bacterium]|jgi:hypothetical protein